MDDDIVEAEIIEDETSIFNVEATYAELVGEVVCPFCDVAKARYPRNDEQRAYWAYTNIARHIKMMHPW